VTSAHGEQVAAGTISAPGHEISAQELGRMIERLPRDAPGDRSVRLARIDLSNALVKGDCAFHDLAFTGSTTFDNTIFEGDVSFEGAVFERDADFSGIVVAGDATFRDASFRGEAIFTGMQVEGDGDFTGVEAQRRFSFDAVTIGGETYFYDARFLDGVDLSRVTFGDHLTFANAWFASARWLGPMLVDGELDFDEAIFDRHVSIEASARRLSCDRAVWTCSPSGRWSRPRAPTSPSRP
jgi:hypothetical protein